MHLNQSAAENEILMDILANTMAVDIMGFVWPEDWHPDINCARYGYSWRDFLKDELQQF